MQTVHTKQRYSLIDSVRGFAIINMVLFHLYFDVAELFRLGFTINDTVIDVWQLFICTTFMIISGISLNFFTSRLTQRYCAESARLFNHSRNYVSCTVGANSLWHTQFFRLRHTDYSAASGLYTLDRVLNRRRCVGFAFHNFVRRSQRLYRTNAAEDFSASRFSVSNRLFGVSRISVKVFLFR